MNRILSILGIYKKQSVRRKIVQSGLGLSIVPIILLIALGTMGYAYFEGWPLLDALYATVITMTTVGYGDLSPQTAPGRLFAVLFTLSAIGLASYAISTLAAVVIDWQSDRVNRKIQEERMEKIAALKDHIIICGCGPIGRVSAYFFNRAKQPIILLDDNERNLKLTLLHLDDDYLSKKYARYCDVTKAVDITEDELLSLEALTERVETPYLLAGPTDDSSLMAAGLEQASGVVVALDSDERNLFAVVSARALANQLNNPNLRIIAVVNDDKNGNKLQLGGANQLVLPEKASGQQVHLWMTNPNLGAFWMNMSFKGGSHNFKEFPLSEHRDWVGKPVKYLQENHKTLVLALNRNGELHYAPSLDEKLKATDIVIAFAPKTE